MPMPSLPTEERHGPMHREIMTELRAIRAQMAKAARRPAATAMADRRLQSVAHELAEAHAMLETYRAQIEQCEKLKVELDLIHDAINRTKREIATLHGKSFDGEEMAKVNGELGAVVGGTEQATQQILEAAESIDQAATALSKVDSVDQQKRLAEDIQERVISIFEACNFQDLTGQRISKVMTTMKFIEQHINAMMDIWGGVDAIKAHVPPRSSTTAATTKSCSTARSSTAMSATPRRTTSTRCSTERTRDQKNETPAKAGVFCFWRSLSQLSSPRLTGRSSIPEATVGSQLSPRRTGCPDQAGA